MPVALSLAFSLLLTPFPSDVSCIPVVEGVREAGGKHSTEVLPDCTVLTIITSSYCTVYTQCQLHTYIIPVLLQESTFLYNCTVLSYTPVIAFAAYSLSLCTMCS